MPRTIPKERNLKYALGSTDAFIAEVAPGESFTVECAINCNAGVITSLDKQLAPWRAAAQLRARGQELLAE
jgi:amidase